MLLVALIPGAAALTTETYNIAVGDQSRDNPATGQILSHSVTVDPYAFGETPEDSFAIVTVTYTGTTNTAGTGIYAFTSTWDGSAISCNWAIETVNTGLSTSVSYPFHGVFCRIQESQLTAGSHTLAFSRATASGTPSTLNHETMSYRIDRTDILPTPDLEGQIAAHDDDMADGFGNLTGYLDHINAHLHALDANLDATRAEILAAIAALNFTVIGNVTGNFTLDDATLTSIYSEIQQHREHSLEVTMHDNQFSGLGLDGFLFFVFWMALTLLFFWLRMKWLTAGAMLAVLASVVPGFNYGLQTAVVMFLLGIGFQYLTEREEEVKTSGETKPE